MHCGGVTQERYSNTEKNPMRRKESVKDEEMGISEGLGDQGICITNI